MIVKFKYYLCLEICFFELLTSKIMKKIFLLIFAGFLFLHSWGQTRDVSGIVVSENGFPIKNIKLSVVDIPVSAKTNKSGRFLLKKVQSEDTIVVHIGKKSYVKIHLADFDSLKIVLSDKMVSIHDGENAPIMAPIQEAVSNMHETRSVSVITSKMIERRSLLSIADAIKNMAPGVNVVNGGSGELIVTMRGIKSFTLPQNALIILDGMETTFDQANAISVHEVDNIEINKDGIGYGVKGANGVVIINLKK